MIEICQECDSFQTTSQRLADQARTIIKEGWFSDLEILEILEIYQKIHNEQDSNTLPDISSINKQKQPHRNEPPTSENGNTTQLNNAQPKNPEQTLTQEQKVNLENLKRIMNSEKTNSDDVENINSTNKGRDLLLTNKPWNRKNVAKDPEAQQSYFTEISTS